MSNTQTIQTGPFKGHVVPNDHLRIKIESDRVVGFWPHSDRLAVFLARNTIGEGWGFQVDQLDSNLEITTTVEINGVEQTVGPFKTLRFVAKLTKNGDTVMTASTLTPMNVVKAYESGENNALSRLLDHLGLPAVFQLSPSDLAGKPLSTETQVSETRGVKLLPTPDYAKSDKIGSTTPPASTTSTASTASQSSDDNTDNNDASDASVEESEATPVLSDDVKEAIASLAAHTDSAKGASSETQSVDKRIRMQLLNLHRLHCRGVAFEEPCSNEEALQRIEALQPKEAVTEGAT